MANEAPPDAMINSLVLALGATRVPDMIKRCSHRSNSRAPALRSKFQPFHATFDHNIIKAAVLRCRSTRRQIGNSPMTDDSPESCDGNPFLGDSSSIPQKSSNLLGFSHNLRIRFGFFLLLTFSIVLIILYILSRALP